MVKVKNPKRVPKSNYFEHQMQRLRLHSKVTKPRTFWGNETRLPR